MAGSEKGTDTARQSLPIHTSNLALFDAGLHGFVTGLGARFQHAFVKRFGRNYRTLVLHTRFKPRDSLFDSVGPEFAQADELVSKLLALRSQREDLLVKCYRQVREKMGGKVAARFLQVENQLLLLIDLKIASVLPAVE